MKFLIFLPLFVFLCVYADARQRTKYTITDERAIRAIVGEAANQGYLGMYYVACAIRNRGTLRGVYGLTAEHADRENAYTWKLAQRAWIQSERRDWHGQSVAHTCDSWYSTEDLLKNGLPKNKDLVFSYRDHIFFKNKPKPTKETHHVN